MSRYWFRAKTYGYGWVPATWQGWSCIAVYVLVVSVSVASNTVYFHQVSQNMLQTIAEVIFYTIILLGICFYTGETPYWQWGKKKS